MQAGPVTTPSFSGEERSSLKEIGEKAQRALKERPAFSIRARLGLGFVVWLVLSLSIAIISTFLISRIKDKLYFTEAANNYTFEIQQARRFEKNYFLYHTNLNDALEHVHNAQLILDSEQGNIESVVGQSNFAAMAGHVERYEDLLIQLQKDAGKELDKKATDALDWLKGQISVRTN